jgi:hypothetical protein
MENEYILHLKYTASSITMDDVHDSEKIRQVLAPDRPIHVITDILDVRSTDAAARRHTPHASTRQIAVVYGSPVGRMLGNVFLRLKGSEFKTRLFSNRAKGIEWLERSGPPKE